MICFGRKLLHVHLKTRLVSTAPVEKPSEPTPETTTSAATAEQVITPWEVQGDEETGIDYDKLIQQFGCTKISPELIARFEAVTGHKCHHLIRRGIIYSAF